MSGQSKRAFDVAVIGAGPAGATAARSLALAGFRTLLAGRGRAAVDAAGESLPPAANALLQRLDLWPEFQRTSPLACPGNRSSWGAAGVLIDHDFIRDRNGCGWHVDRSQFDEMLCQAAETAGACRDHAMALAGVDRARGRWRLGFKGESREIEAQYVVDASGRARAFARRLGVARLRADPLLAIVAVLQPRGEPAVDSSTLVEATRDGWWYSALVPSGKLAAAFTTGPAELGRRRLWSRSGWDAVLQESIYTRDRIRSGGYALTGGIRVLDASPSRLEHAAGDGWLAAGDAAVAHDPLSSDGIGRALQDGLRAAEAIESHAGGSGTALADYSAPLLSAFSRYLLIRNAYYAQEDRWLDAPFWRTRRT